MTLDSLKGKRCFISYAGAASADSAFVTIEDIDEFFVVISNEVPKNFDGEVVPRIHTYVRRDLVETITDVSNPRHEEFLHQQIQAARKLQEQLAKTKRDHMRAQQGNDEPSNND